MQTVLLSIRHVISSDIKRSFVFSFVLLFSFNFVFRVTCSKQDSRQFYSISVSICIHFILWCLSHPDCTTSDQKKLAVNVHINGTVRQYENFMSLLYTSTICKWFLVILQTCRLYSGNHWVSVKRLLDHFDGLLEPVLVVLSGKAISKDSSTFVLPQQQQAAFTGDDVSRSVQHSLQQDKITLWRPLLSNQYSYKASCARPG